MMLREWIKNLSYNENDMRTDAVLKFRIMGITEGNTLSFLDSVGREVKKVTNHDILDVIYSIADDFRSDGMYHLEQVNAVIGRFKNGLRDDFYLDVTANIHLSDTLDREEVPFFRGEYKDEGVFDFDSFWNN